MMVRCGTCDRPSGEDPGDCRSEGGAECVRHAHARLRDAIERHRLATHGHGSCWENDLELWRTIDPGVEYPHTHVPPREEFMHACEVYYAGLACALSDTCRAPALSDTGLCKKENV